MKERKNWSVKEQAQDWVNRELARGKDPSRSSHYDVGARLCKCGDCFCCHVVAAVRRHTDGPEVAP